MLATCAAAWLRRAVGGGRPCAAAARRLLASGPGQHLPDPAEGEGGVLESMQVGWAAAAPATAAVAAKREAVQAPSASLPALASWPAQAARRTC